MLAGIACGDHGSPTLSRLLVLEILVYIEKLEQRLEGSIRKENLISLTSLLFYDRSAEAATLDFNDHTAVVVVTT
jgi:hypothetical protein